MKKYLFTLLPLATVSMALAQIAPVVEYKFSGPDDTIQQSTGTANDDGARLSIRDATNTAAALTSETGVSGVAGDWALDFTSAPGTGSNAGGDGPFAHVDSDASLPAIDGLASFTLQGWFKTDIAPTDGMEFIKNASSSGGFMLKAVNDGALRLYVNGARRDFAVIAENKDWATTGEWVFFAVTYDGLSTENNVNFYVGGINQRVTLSSTQTLNQGVVQDEENRLTISRNNRPFRGLLDNIRIYGSPADSAGVLTIQELEAVRLGDGGVAVALASFTLQGWFKTDIVPTDGMELIKNVSSSGGFILKAVNDGALSLYVINGAGGDFAVISENKDWATTGEWVFFAATYDGLSTENNVNFYVGGINQAVTLSSTQTLNQGVVEDEEKRLSVSRNNRPFKGLLENIRIYGSLGDSEGVLTIEELEAVRLGDGGRG